MDFFGDIFQKCIEASEYVKAGICKDTACTDVPHVALFVTNDQSAKNALRLPPEAVIPGTDGHVLMAMPIASNDPFDMRSLLALVPPFKVDAVCLLSEGYYRSTGHPENYKRGDMQREYESNPFSDVRPALVLLGVDVKSLQTGMVLLSYKYDDRGVPEFDPACHKQVTMYKEGDASVSGRAVDAIMQFAKLCRSRHAKED